MGTGRRTFSLRKRLLALLLGSVVAFLMFEIGLRLLNPFGVRIKGQQINLPSNVTFVQEAPPGVGLDAEIVHRKNSLGFRGPDFPREPERYFKILTVGGSTTECMLLSEGKTWPDEMARRLQTEFDGLWINNAGLDGHSTFGHKILVDDLLGAVAPQMVLFLVGLNDLERDDLRTWDRNHSIRGSSPAALFKRLANHSETANLVLNLARNVRARRAGLFGRYLSNEPHTELQLSPEQQQQILARQTPYIAAYRQRIVDLIDATRALGAEPVLITQPALYNCAVDPTTGRDLALARVRGGWNGCISWQVLELYNDVTRATGAAHDTFVIDLARELPHDSQYYYDFVHYNNRGAEEVGRIVASALQERGYSTLTLQGR